MKTTGTTRNASRKTTASRRPTKLGKLIGKAYKQIATSLMDGTVIRERVWFEKGTARKLNRMAEKIRKISGCDIEVARGTVISAAYLSLLGGRGRK